MSILSKVTLGLVSIAALCFWYMAMRTLKTHQAWRTAVQNHEKALDAAEVKIVNMIDGDAEKAQLSLGQLQTALNAALYGRGRTWSDVSPRFDAASGNVTVAVERPQPHEIKTGMVLDAFQGLDDPTTARYVGEFKVTAVDGNNVTLTPSYRLTAAARATLQQARGPWSLYESLPADTNELFAGMTEDQIRDILPPAPQRLQGESNDDFQARQLEHQRLIDEYAKDNKPIDPDNPPPPERIQVLVKFVKNQSDLDEAAKADLRLIDFGENLVKSGVVMKVDLKTATELVRLGLVQEVERRYQRQLRDYGYLLAEFYRRLPLVEDQIVNLQKDLDYMIEANKIADSQLADTRKQEVALKAELALVSKERDVVGQYQTTLQERLAKVNAEISRLLADNQRLAAQLSQKQLEAVRGPSRSAAATALAAPRQ